MECSRSGSIRRKVVWRSAALPPSLQKVEHGDPSASVELQGWSVQLFLQVHVREQTRTFARLPCADMILATSGVHNVGSGAESTLQLPSFVTSALRNRATVDPATASDRCVR